MYSQANVKAGKVLRSPIRPLPSVIVVTERVMREADGPVENSALTLPSGGKVIAPECASKPSRSWRGARRIRSDQDSWKGIRSYLPRLHLKARRMPNLKVKTCL